MKPYYITYIESTGMGPAIKTETFSTIQERVEFYQKLQATGCRVVEFGRIGS